MLSVIPEKKLVPQYPDLCLRKLNERKECGFLQAKNLVVGGFSQKGSWFGFAWHYAEASGVMVNICQMEQKKNK